MRKIFSSGYLLVIFSAIALSFKSILVKFAFAIGVNPMTLMLMRLFVALPFFIIALSVIEGKGAFKLKAREACSFAVMGIGGMVFILIGVITVKIGSPSRLVKATAGSCARSRFPI